MPEKYIGLVSDYIKIKRKSSGELTFGGDQNFFAVLDRAEDKFKNCSFRKLPEDEKKRRMGCGIVALSDLFFYLAQRNQTNLNTGLGYYVNFGLHTLEESYVNREPYAEEDYVNHNPETKEESNLKAILTESGYCQYYNAVLAFAGKITKNGVSGLKLSRSFNRMARKQGWRERAFWGFCKRKMLPRIEEMLGKDIPVILCIPMAVLKKHKDRKLSFYKKDDRGNYILSTATNGHYIVVTEIFYEKEEIYLVISSWGKQYFVKWKEYEEMVYSLFLGGFLGNLLYIR